MREDIYELTDVGRRIARSTNNPDTTEFRIIHQLDKWHRASRATLAEYCGGAGEVVLALRRLKRNNVIAEITTADLI